MTGRTCAGGFNRETVRAGGTGAGPVGCGIAATGSGTDKSELDFERGWRLTACRGLSWRDADTISAKLEIDTNSTGWLTGSVRR